MSKLYKYVGPSEILRKASKETVPRYRIKSEKDLVDFCLRPGTEKSNFTGKSSFTDKSNFPGKFSFTSKSSFTEIVTFILDERGALWIADRHSEHLACARGQPVRSAGEMTVFLENGHARLLEITNQSTGFCPEPDSWPDVRAALDSAGIPSPEGFTHEFLFRRCPSCSQINIVKNGIWECSICLSELPKEWNLDNFLHTYPNEE